MHFKMHLKWHTNWSSNKRSRCFANIENKTRPERQYTANDVDIRFVKSGTTAFTRISIIYFALFDYILYVTMTSEVWPILYVQDCGLFRGVENRCKSIDLINAFSNNHCIVNHECNSDENWLICSPPKIAFEHFSNNFKNMQKWFPLITSGSTISSD